MDIPIRDFAAKMGCGVANIYKHIKQNPEELEGHIIKKGSKQYLDDYAQEFLSSLISPKAIKIEDQELLNEINKLRALVVDLTTKNNNLINENAELRVERQKIDSERLLIEQDRDIQKEKFEAAEKREKEHLSKLDEDDKEIKRLNEAIEKRDKANWWARLTKKYD